MVPSRSFGRLLAFCRSDIETVEARQSENEEPPVLTFAPDSDVFRRDPMRAVDTGALPSISVGESLRANLHVRSPLA